LPTPMAGGIRIWWKRLSRRSMPAVEDSRWLGTPMAGKPTQRLYPARLPRRPVRTGRVGRPPPRVPEGLSLTQTIKHRDERGRLLEVERRTTIGTAAAATAAVQQPVPVHIERLNGLGVQGPAGGPDAQDARVCQDRPDVGCAVWVVDIRAQLAAEPSGIERTVSYSRATLRAAHASDGGRVDRSPLVVAGVSDHEAYYQLLRESLPEFSARVRIGVGQFIPSARAAGFLPAFSVKLLACPSRAERPYERWSSGGDPVL
jgi:hypothetical protein